MSATATPGIAAPDSLAAANTRSINSADTHGRAASWTATNRHAGSSAESAAAIVSWRSAPPSITVKFDESTM